MKDTGGVLSTRVTSVSPRRWKNWSIYVLAIVAGGCAGGGCACVAPIPGGFPADARTPNSVQVRLSDSGLGYIENNVKDFIGLVLPGGLSFPIPSQCGSDQQVCCGASWCSIQADIDKRPGDAPRLELNPVASVPGLMDVVLRARVHTPYALPVRKKVLLFWTSCNVSINSRWSGNPSITIRTQVRFAEDPTSGEMRVRVAGASVSNLTAGDIDISGGLFCGFANENDVVSLFANEFANRVPAMIEEQVCKSCQTHDDCAPYGQCYTDGVCYINDGSGFRCMNSGGFSGRLQSRELLGSLAHPTRSRAVDFYVAQGGHRSTLDNGLTLGLLGGVMPHDRDSCVPVAPEPARPDIATASVLEQNVHPKTGATFDVGLGLHKSYLDRFAWAAQQAGWLCVNMSSASIEMLTASALSLFFPSIADLAPEGDAMLYLLVRPQKPPTMTLGAGTFTTDGSGANEIDEALLNIGLTDLEIDFYLQSDDQWVRVLTLVADATIPMALDVDGEGKVVPILGDIAEAFTNLRVKNSALLAEPPEEIAAKFPALLQFVLPMLADTLGGTSFELPGFMGLSLSLGEGSFTSLEGDSFLGVFGNLVAAPEVMAKPLEPVRTKARVAGVNPPPVAAYTGSGLLAHEPSVDLVMDDGAWLEWQFRVDGGFWTPFTDQPNVRLARSEFFVPGVHTVQVRGRVKGQTQTLDPQGQTLRFHIEPTTADVPVPAAEPAFETVVPPASQGNFQGRVPDDGSGCDCRVAPRSGSDPSGQAGWLAVLLIGLVWRPRRSWKRLMAVLLVVSGCGSDAGTGAIGPDAAPPTEPAPEAARLAPGDIGRWGSIAAEGNRVVVVAYEEKYGDLVWSEVSPDGTFDFVPLDGVPADAPVVGEETAYRGGVKRPGPDVGAWTQVAVNEGNVFVSYTDRDRSALRFGQLASDGFAAHDVDVPTGDETVGLYASLLVTSDGLPAIAYLVHGLAPDVDLDAPDSLTSELRLALANTPEPRSADDWTITVVDRSNVIPPQSPPAYPTLPEAVGLFADLGQLPDGRLAIAYYDRIDGDVYVSVEPIAADAPWQKIPLHANDVTDTGEHTSLVVDSAGTVHVVYQETVDAILLYRSLTFADDDTFDISPATVIDDGSREGERPHPVGGGAALALDSAGTLVVVHQDGATADLLIARQAEDGTWTRDDAFTGPTGYGFWNGLAATTDALWVYTSGHEAGASAPTLPHIKRM